MIDTPRLLSFASAGALALALTQGVAAAEPAAPAAAPAATPAAPAAAPSDTGRGHADEHRAHWEEMRAQHGIACDQMKRMTPEERRAARETHWQEMRARAAKRGVELPQTPPWVAAEQRQQAAREQFEKYRKTVEALTPEQREAAEAVFGSGGPQGPGPDWGMPPLPPRGGYGYGPQGGYPGYGYGYGPYQGGPGPMPYDDDGMAQDPAAPAAPPVTPPAAN